MTDLSEAQRREIHEYLGLIKSGKKIQSHVYAQYKSWCIENRKTPISSETLRLWVLEERNPKKTSSFSDYVSSNAWKEDQDAENLLFHSINCLFSTGHSDINKILNRLVGRYRLTRRLWTPLYSDNFLECPVEFYMTSAGLIFREWEVFTSLYAIEEIYTGYSFVFNSSFWILAQDEKLNAIKFLTIHECTPPIMSESKTINTCKGNLIAVSGRGPNFSNRFVLSRLSQPLSSGRIISKHQINLDRDSLEYLYGNDDTK